MLEQALEVGRTFCPRIKNHPLVARVSNKGSMVWVGEGVKSPVQSMLFCKAPEVGRGR
jgi:hypothetical protein